MSVRTRRFLQLLVLLLPCLGASPAESGDEPSPVGTLLLTFDTELDPDADALRTLGIDLPATYFFTGAYAEQHPTLLRQLAAGPNSIGSHSYHHDHLTTLDPKHLRMDLALSKLVIENISGRKLRWFRAPYLEYDYSVMQNIAELGFDFDSSDIEVWLKNDFLPELGISYHDGRLASDYDMFVSDGLADQQALDWLTAAYDHKAAAGQPFVFLMHPRIIGDHAPVLHGLIAHVKRTGGRFLTVDDYVAELRAPAAGSRLGMWVDLSFEDVEIDTLVEDALSLGITDVFLSAIDPAGVSYLGDASAQDGPAARFDPILRALKTAGLRVHAWVSTNSNVALAAAEPELAMEDAEGRRSSQWLSPSNPRFRERLRRLIIEMIQGRDLDGLHLDYIRYPDLQHDFSQDALARFKAASGVAEVTAEELLTEHFVDWMAFRESEIHGLTREIAAAVRARTGDDFELSAALIADAAVDFRSRETFGQNYARLAPELDLVVPMAYYPLERREPAWVERVLFAARTQVGDTALLTGLATFTQAGEWAVGPQDFEQALGHAKSYSGGAVFYPYSGLFGRRPDGSNVPRAVLETVRTASSSEILVDPTRESSGGFTLDTHHVVWGLIALAMALTAAIAVATRRRRSPADDRGGNAPGTASRLTNGAARSYWRGLAAKLGQDELEGKTCQAIGGLLRSHKPEEIERMRLHYALSRAEPCGAPAQSISNGAGEHVVRTVLSQSLANARALGWVDLRGGIWIRTRDGERELEHALVQGFEPEYYAFLEHRFEEILSTTCPVCGTSDVFNYFWPTFECRRCGKEVHAADGTQIQIMHPDNAGRHQNCPDWPNGRSGGATNGAAHPASL